MSDNLTLAIAPGTRELGIAVFSGFDLLCIGVKTIKHHKSERNVLEETALILKEIFQEFSINAVVIKAVSQYQKLSLVLDEVVERIKFECRRKKLQFAEITIEQIKSELCKIGKPTQRKAFETLLSVYPELGRYWNRPNKWQNDYYAFLFSAVAVGIVFLKGLV
ncbi:MAG: hypothetical protein LUM44_11360 [Pyrinomonadaceae bacterium]|nr:hypothetical protein [Pyrinomonadaceae bacterium]